MAKPDIVTEPPVCPFGACEAGGNKQVVGRGRDFLYRTSDREFTYVRCADCSVWHLSAIPDKASMALIYPSDYYAFDDSKAEPGLVGMVRGRMEAARIDVFRRLLAERPLRVLDIGCGDGRLLDIFRRHGDDDWELAGVEFAPAAAEAARAKGYQVIEGDIMEIDSGPWKGRFDLIVMQQVLEHMHRPAEAVRKAHEILRDGGIMCVETPCNDAWDARLFRRRHWGGYHLPRHFFLFDRPSLGRLMEEAGYRVISSRQVLSPVLWIHSLHNWLSERPVMSGLAPIFGRHNVVLLMFFTILDLILMRLTGKSSNMEVMGRK